MAENPGRAKRAVSETERAALAAVNPYLDALPFYVLVLDAEHNILAANRAVYAALGKSPGELLGCYCPRIIHDLDGPYPGCPLEESLATGGGPVEKEFRDEKGWVESMVYPVPGWGTPERPVYLHFVRDISPRKQAEADLRELKDALDGKVRERTVELARACAELEEVAVARERLARVGEISAGVAHAVRNPLHGLLNCAELLQRRVSGDDALAQELLTFLGEGLRRIESVTRRLLSLTRETPLQKAPTDVNRLVEHALSFVGERLRQSQVELVTRLGRVPLCELDADRLLEALLNLIDNAVQACPQGGKVTLSTSVSGAPAAELVLEVADTGPGIPVELRQKVFDPFFTTKAVGEGTGLGLAVTKRVVEEHGGRVELESEPSEGTRVRVILPWGRGAAGEVADD